MSESITDLTAYQLSGIADCASPDSLESAGAAFLTSVRDAAVEAYPRVRPVTGEEDRSDVAHEIADDAPSVYTATKWAQFVDLGAYREEPEATDAWPASLDDAASVALYQIAERLTLRVWDEMEETEGDTED
jgi:hypothetical protein